MLYCINDIGERTDKQDRVYLWWDTRLSGVYCVYFPVYYRLLPFIADLR